MRRLSSYVRPLLTVEERTPWFLPVVGAVLLAVASNWFYDLVKTEFGTLGTLIVLIVLFSAGALAVAVYTARLERDARRDNIAVKDKPHPPRHAGLVILVSNRDVVKKAIDHHRPELQHCWLIVTPETMKVAAEVEESYLSQVKCHVCDIANEYDTSGCLELVRRIFTIDAPQHQISPSQVIADFTGGTKPMTAAVVMACLTGRWDMQHTPTLFRVDNGRRVPVQPLDPIEIVIQHEVERDPTAAST